MRKFLGAKLPRMKASELLWILISFFSSFCCFWLKRCYWMSGRRACSDFTLRIRSYKTQKWFHLSFPQETEIWETCWRDKLERILFSFVGDSSHNFPGIHLSAPFSHHNNKWFIATIRLSISPAKEFKKINKSNPQTVAKLLSFIFCWDHLTISKSKTFVLLNCWRHRVLFVNCSVRRKSRDWSRRTKHEWKSTKEEFSLTENGGKLSEEREFSEFSLFLSLITCWSFHREIFSARSGILMI